MNQMKNNLENVNKKYKDLLLQQNNNNTSEL